LFLNCKEKNEKTDWLIVWKGLPTLAQGKSHIKKKREHQEKLLLFESLKVVLAES